MKVGVQSVSYYVPHLYLEIKDLAVQRGIDPLKLEKGLGLHKMAFPDVHEDVATFAAEALLRLMKDYEIDPREINRIYLGTESALDAAKPTATFAVHMVEQVLEYQYGERCFKNCDAVDMTFACIGGVDALQNALDYVRVNPHKKAIVIASDYAKYELASGGEYTQGGGAVALLISSQPDLLEIENHWGVGMESVFDFFKPRRHYSKEALQNAPENYPDKIEIFSDEPVFDGQYSNECFKDRIREAYLHYKEEKGINENAFKDWRFLIFHLPYAFHGKRIFSEIFALENDLAYSTNEEVKLVAGSEEYKTLVKEKIEPSQRASSEIGNMYTASLFMALLSALEVSYQRGEDIAEQKIGFFAYGSGSKSKVFTATVGKNWKHVVEKWKLFDTLKQRQAIDFDTYEKLHRKQLDTPVNMNKKGFKWDFTEEENPVLKGARYYRYQ
ncbi:hydroxymethylglutaryl-CoA synthase [Elizabethkingia argentiflava]|uniref:Hydroxymethylglutaryl-CoA synthase n=1 Tax=Elizabethkingia argenteiflava TaxID=2681556 RepID=A0A845PQ13_9FLAO|nr:hydroxymethylglutaryl-CoA synthase family protein [Elizabethkingia argenteiflava]NAW50252.1 hydroxymethylglutaryl-CoA synthase [Elizabethkingia argenteiflava]